MSKIKKSCKYYNTDECKSKNMALIICEPCDKNKPVCPTCGDSGIKLIEDHPHSGMFHKSESGEPCPDCQDHKQPADEEIREAFEKDFEISNFTVWDNDKSEYVLTEEFEIRQQVYSLGYKAAIKHFSVCSKRMTTNYIINKLRNPYGSDKRKVRFEAANEIEHWKDAYENMREFAVKNGLDINTYNNQIGENQ